MRLLLIVAALACTLAGCGFQLRGSSTAAEALAGRTIHLDADRAPAAGVELRQILNASGVHVARRAKGAEYTIRLAGEKISRDVLSVSPQTGKVEEFQLTYVVLLSVQRAGGETLLDGVPVTLQRDFTFDQDAVLGNFSEEEILRDEMAREAAEQILRRSAAAIDHDEPPPAA
jgi:LPS-assembly lipoprotein